MIDMGKIEEREAWEKELMETDVFTLRRITLEDRNQNW